MYTIVKTNREITMTDPITAITASAIAHLAFQEFIKSGAGELAKKFTTEAIAKMGELRKTILNKLRGKSQRVDEALIKAETGDIKAIETVTKYLDVEMDKNSDFAEQIKNIAHQINIGKIQDNSSMTQNNFDNATGYQTKVEGGTAFIGTNHVHHPK